MDSILVPSMLGFVIDPTSPQMLWADAYSCFDWQNNYAILCSENSSENRRTNSGKQTHRDKRRGTEIQNSLSICSATLDFCPPFGAFLTYRLWKKQGTCCSHLNTCLYLPFPSQNHHFDFTPCWKWQPACIFLVFSRRNSVAVGVCTMHGELTPIPYPSYTENPSLCCTSTLTSGDNFSFSIPTEM